MRTGRIPAWLTLILAAVGLLLVAIPGLWVFVGVTATRLHPDPENVPTVAYSVPLPKWAGIVEKTRQMARASVARQNLPGLSVAVGIDGDIVWAEGFGFADLKTRVPVTPDHRFRIGTASTVLTSAAAGLLLENGRLKLDAEIQTYVPAFPRMERPVTLRQLMGHTPGVFPDIEGDEPPLYSKHCERPVEMLQHFPANWLPFEPGTYARYSIYDWILVSAAVEAAADQPFLKFMQERIFDPLGMRDTIADLPPDPAAVNAGDDDGFPLLNLIRELIFDPRGTRDITPDSASDYKTKPDSTNQPSGDRVTSYSPRFASDPNYGLHLMHHLDSSCFAGAGVFISTPSDLVRFGMAMNSGKLLKPSTVELLQTPQLLPSGKETDYGLGWYRKTVTLAGKKTRLTGLDGDSLGYAVGDGMVASLMTFPEYGMAVAVTSNISYAGTSSVGMKIAEAFAEQGRNPAPK